MRTHGNQDHLLFFIGPGRVSRQSGDDLDLIFETVWKIDVGVRGPALARAPGPRRRLPPSQLDDPSCAGLVDGIMNYEPRADTRCDQHDVARVLDLCRPVVQDQRAPARDRCGQRVLDLGFCRTRFGVSRIEVVASRGTRRRRRRGKHEHGEVT